LEKLNQLPLKIKDQMLALIDRRYELRIALLNYLNYARLKNAIER
jgi:hypothetical protein